MRTRLLSGSIALSAALYLFTSPASALTIDHFADPLGAPLDIASGGGNPTSVTSTQTGLAGTVGGQRRVEETRTSGTSSVGVNIPGDSRAYHSNGAATWSNQLYVYGFSADLNLDLTGDDSFLVTDVLGLDLTFIGPAFFRTVDLTLEVVSGGGTASSTQTLLADGDYTFDFSDFAGVDFSDVDEISFAFAEAEGLGEGAAADYSFDSFETVPEPSTALLLGFGLIGINAARRRS